MDTNPVVTRKRPYGEQNMQAMDAKMTQRDLVVIDPDIVKIIIDTATSDITYVCKAECGSLTTDEKWQIQRISTVGAVQTIEWADGNGLFDNCYEDRASITYL